MPTQAESSETPRTATFVRKADWGADVRVYAVDPPMPVDDDEPTRFVAVSAVNAPYGGPETYIFPCDAYGEVTSWGELDGSYRGGLDHERALADAGYELAPAAEPEA